MQGQKFKGPLSFIPIKPHIPVIPPHPTIPCCPKNDEVLSSGPRKKRISYKSEDEKREALRERSRDNRRKAKERKEYMDRRIKWLLYENAQLSNMILQREAKVEALKRQLLQMGIDYTKQDLYVYGGPEVLYRNAGLEVPAFTFPEESSSESESPLNQPANQTVSQPAIPRETRSQKRKREEEIIPKHTFAQDTMGPFNGDSLSLLDPMKSNMMEGVSHLDHCDSSSRLFAL